MMAIPNTCFTETKRDWKTKAHNAIKQHNKDNMIYRQMHVHKALDVLFYKINKEIKLQRLRIPIEKMN